jgi:hypothetical protein
MRIMLLMQRLWMKRRRRTKVNNVYTNHTNREKLDTSSLMILKRKLQKELLLENIMLFVLKPQ